MSYKKKKIKKSVASRLIYRYGKVRNVLLKNLARIARKIQKPKTSQEVRMFDMEKVLTALRFFDRLQDNPDRSRFAGMIRDQREELGFLRLNVFICPKFSPDALFSSSPEKYMPADANTLGLFELRVEKIRALRAELLRAGLPTELNLLVGDNDADAYIFPFMDPSPPLDARVYAMRREAYRRSFEEKCKKLFGPATAAWSLGGLGITAGADEPQILKEAFAKEEEFFRWLFSCDGPYRGKLSFSSAQIAGMVQRKYGLYGEQGKFLEMLGGLLLQTEGPGVWRERTQMLRCTGSSAVPALYPWIRKDEQYG
jgi:hypothetical protein